MNKISILSDEIIARIRAGEVIQRPVNIVKELLENSLDAGATEIRIKIENGGKKSIEVSDNGSGMNHEDAKMCLVPHATSKVRTLDDLNSIKTLGFRGEALHSIATVSMFELRTKETGSDIGIMVSCFGNQVSHKLIGCSDGTYVSAKAIFYNTPPRKASLKADAAETHAVSKLIGRYMLLHPEIGFTYLVNNATHLVQRKDMTEESMISSILGAETARGLRRIDYTTDGATVSGFVSSPSLVKKNSDYIILSINGRYVEQIQPYVKTIRDAYRKTIQTHDYPVVILRISVDPAKIDPNIHPQKSGVAVLDEDFFRRILFEAVMSCQRHFQSFPESCINKITPLDENSPLVLNEDEANEVNNSFCEEPLEKSKNAIGKCEEFPYETVDSINISSPSEIRQNLPPLEVVGQYLKTFIMASADGYLFMIDQHALHEKIIYEELMAKTTIDSVKPVEAYALHISTEDSDMLESSVELFKAYGLDIDRLDNDTWKVYSVPAINGVPVPENEILALIRDTIGNLSDKPSLDDFRSKVMAEVACKSSIRANQLLTYAEMTRLLRQGENMKNAYYCPHGRPAVKVYKEETVNRWFKRT